MPANLDDLAFDSECQREREALSKTPEAPLAVARILRGEDGRTTVQQNGRTAQRQNFSTGHLPQGDAFATEDGDGILAISPTQRPSATDPIPMVVQRRAIAGTEAIMPFMACSPRAPRQQISVLSGEGTQLEVDISNQQCWIVNRDQIAQSVMGLYFVEVENFGKRIESRVGEPPKIERVTETGVTQGGCDNTNYGTPFSYPTDRINEDTQRVTTISPDVSFRKRFLPLAPGDTHVLFEETVSHNGFKDSFRAPSFKSRTTLGGDNGGAVVFEDRFRLRFTNNAGNSLFINAGSFGLISYEWRLSSWPSGGYEIFGSGSKIADIFSIFVAQQIGVTAQFGGATVLGGDLGISLLPFCSGFQKVWRAATIDEATSTQPDSKTESILIAVQSVEDRRRSYVSSSVELDFFNVAIEQKAWRTSNNENIARPIGPRDLEFLQMPNLLNLTDPNPTGPIYELGIRAFEGTRGRIINPSILIPTGEFNCYLAYGDIAIDTEERVTREVAPGEFTEPTLADPKLPLQSEVPTWPTPCAEAYSTENQNHNPVANKGYAVSVIDLAQALQSNPRLVEFQGFEIADAAAACESNPASGGRILLDQIEGLEPSGIAIISAGPNKVPKEFGKLPNA